MSVLEVARTESSLQPSEISASKTTKRDAAADSMSGRVIADSRDGVRD